MSLRIMITGGSGFIGRHLVATLQDRHQVHAPTSHELNLLDQDALDAFLANLRPDIVIHAATWNATTVSARDTSRTLGHNLRMFSNVVRARKHFGRLIHFGSGAEFAREHWRGDLSEDDLGRHVPEDAYGFSKYWIAQLTERLPSTLNLRLFGVFGPHEDWRIRFLSNAACRLLYGLPVTLRRDRRFDYLHVDDVGQAVRLILDRPDLQGNLNLCRTELWPLSQLAAFAAKAAGVPLKLQVAAPGEDLPYGGANARFRAHLSEWQPRPIEDSIGRLVDWYRAHLETIPEDAVRRAY